MKKLIVVLVVVLVLCVPVQAGDFTTWIWTNNDATGVRLGTIFEDSSDTNDLELGLSMLWLPDSGEPEIFGVYVLYHLPDLVQITTPAIFDGILPEIITGKPYVGGDVQLYGGGDMLLVTGITLQRIFFIEYREQGEIIGGLRAIFRF